MKLANIFFFFFTKVRSGGIMHLSFCSPVFASNRVLWFVVLMYLSGDLPQNKLGTCACEIAIIILIFVLHSAS